MQHYWHKTKYANITFRVEAIEWGQDKDNFSYLDISENSTIIEV